MFSKNLKNTHLLSIIFLCSFLLIQPKQASAVVARPINPFPSIITLTVAYTVLVYALDHLKISSWQEKALSTLAEKEHLFLLDKRKEYFLKIMQQEFADSFADSAETRLLTDHKKYRYPSYIEALKETCPHYKQYIKKLFSTLNNDVKQRIVPGFKVIYKSWFFNSSDDFYEFYELIKTLNTEIKETELEESITFNRTKKRDLAILEKQPLQFNTVQ